MSILQSLATYQTSNKTGISLERTAIETELSYLPDTDASNITVDEVGDHIVLQVVVSSSSDSARVIRVAQSIIGYNRIMLNDHLLIKL